MFQLTKKAEVGHSIVGFIFAQNISFLLPIAIQLRELAKHCEYVRPNLLIYECKFDTLLLFYVLLLVEMGNIDICIWLL